MTIDPRSYGSVAAIEALTPQYTANGAFTATTRPARVQVETFIDQVSALINTLLAAQGFTIPITQIDAKRAVDSFVTLEVASFVEYANGAGPWIADASQMRASSPSRIVLKDAEAFIASQALGLEAMGAERARALTAGLDAVDVEPVWDWDWSG
jgi:hypothetical protein